MPDRITIEFDTSATEDRRETGILDGGVLRTQHENRPDFRMEDDGSVTLLAANEDIECEGFGEGYTIVEQQSA